MGYKEAHERLYLDRMDVFRHAAVTAPDGTTNNELSTTPFISKQPCRISFQALDAPYEITETGEPITIRAKIFCDPAIDIQPGDYVAINRKDGNMIMGRYEGLVGAAAYYSGHQEILLQHTRRRT